MPNVVNYVTLFQQELMQKYARELMTADLTTPNARFINANTIKVPYIEVAGYKDHSRNGGFNRQAVKNDFNTYTLAHDRDVEFFVDAMDVDESNQAVAAANTTNEFETQQAIPETDCYRISKLYADFKANGGTVNNDVLTTDNILSKFDDIMEKMDEDEVPEEGRVLYVTPHVNKLLKQAKELARYINMNDPKNEAIKRAITSLDDVKIKKIISKRMKTVYDFTDGCKPGTTAKQINMILLHPKSVIACNKHSYIKLWPEGSHTLGDGYLYQNRQYWDLFVIKNRVEGIYINAEAEA